MRTCRCTSVLQALTALCAIGTACVSAAYAQETNVRLNLVQGSYSLSGAFDGERWSLPADYPFPFLENLDAGNASAIEEILRARYRSCQAGGLQSTLPLTSEYRFHVTMSDTQRMVDEGGIVRFEPVPADGVKLEWRTEFADGKPARESVFLGGVGKYILPLGNDVSAIVDIHNSVCGNKDSSDNCGSAGCGMSILLNGKEYDLLAFDPYSTFENGRWYLHVPRSLNSEAPQQFEFVDGELIGWIYD